MKEKVTENIGAGGGRFDMLVRCELGLEKPLLIILSAPFLIIGFLAAFAWQGVTDGWKTERALEDFYKMDT